MKKTDPYPLIIIKHQTPHIKYPVFIMTFYDFIKFEILNFGLCDLEFFNY
jgi:hypothetical protein